MIVADAKGTNLVAWPLYFGRQLRFLDQSDLGILVGVEMTYSALGELYLAVPILISYVELRRKAQPALHRQDHDSTSQDKGNLISRPKSRVSKRSRSDVMCHPSPCVDKSSLWSLAPFSEVRILHWVRGGSPPARRFLFLRPLQILDFDSIPPATQINEWSEIEPKTTTSHLSLVSQGSRFQIPGNRLSATAPCSKRTVVSLLDHF